MHTIYRLPAPEESPTVVRTAARCADGNGTLTPLFFSDDLVDIARAKAMCAKCPLSAGCLRDAQEREEPWGVWGGELLLNGRIVTSKRPCGRPPKVPRPELVIDELGIVGSVA
ncbi:MAG: WhiB family transcriptional regulator [Actinomycetota bacterium]|nr:WhiB family transcriptional regulator [Actinomycetota bacterium]